MHSSNVKKFYQTLVNSEQFSNKIKNKLRKIKNEEEYKVFIQNELLPISQNMGYKFSVDDILSYEHQALQNLSEKELESITGGNAIGRSLATAFISALAITGGAYMLNVMNTTHATINPPIISETSTISSSASDKDAKTASSTAAVASEIKVDAPQAVSDVSRMQIKDDLTLAKAIADEVDKAGGKTYYIGGYVRDMYTGKPNKDIDIEIHGITKDTLEGILSQFEKICGKRTGVGEKFGVYNLGNFALDIALPRKDTKNIEQKDTVQKDKKSSGHTNFTVDLDPKMGICTAARRRDFTFNALMKDVKTGNIVDLFGGLDDVSNRVIRHIHQVKNKDFVDKTAKDSKTVEEQFAADGFNTDEAFKEDPLRVLRAAQFAARFNFTIADETKALCRDMDLSLLSYGRVMMEMEKALKRADQPAIFFDILKDVNQLKAWFPELIELINISQDPENPTKSTLWEHTMNVLNEASKYKDKASNPLGFMLAALTHSFSKVETVGLPSVKIFMERFKCNNELTLYVTNLAEGHMKLNKLLDDTTKEPPIKSINDIFDSSIDVNALIYLVTLDRVAKGETSTEISLSSILKKHQQYITQWGDSISVTDLQTITNLPNKLYRTCLSLANKLKLAGINKGTTLKVIENLSNAQGSVPANTVGNQLSSEQTASMQTSAQTKDTDKKTPNRKKSKNRGKQTQATDNIDTRIVLVQTLAQEANIAVGQAELDLIADPNKDPVKRTELVNKLATHAGIDTPSLLELIDDLAKK